MLVPGESPASVITSSPILSNSGRTPLVFLILPLARASRSSVFSLLPPSLFSFYYHFLLWTSSSSLFLFRAKVAFFFHLFFSIIFIASFRYFFCWREFFLFLNNEYKKKEGNVFMFQTKYLKQQKAKVTGSINFNSKGYTKILHNREDFAQWPYIVCIRTVRALFRQNYDSATVLVSFLVCRRNWRLSGNESFAVLVSSQLGSRPHPNSNSGRKRHSSAEILASVDEQRASFRESGFR